jgi:hypothetical protein
VSPRLPRHTAYRTRTLNPSTAALADAMIGDVFRRFAKNAKKRRAAAKKPLAAAKKTARKPRGMKTVTPPDTPPAPPEPRPPAPTTPTPAEWSDLTLDEIFAGVMQTTM